MSAMQSIIRVLLIEDEASDAYLVKTTLKQAQNITFDITWADSLIATKQAFCRSCFDVILLDLSLINSEGLDTIQAVRQIVGDEIPIVILTGRSNTEFTLSALEAGVTNYTAKDIMKSGSEDFVGVIRYALLRAELDKSHKLLAAAHLDLDLLRTLNNATIITETDLSGHIISVNEQFLNISEYDETDLLGKTHKVVYSGIHTKEFYLNMWSLIKNGRAWSGEICNRKKSGKLYWVQAIILPVYRKSSGECVKYAMVGLDITDKKEREIAMQKRAALYEAAIETTDGFCHISSSGHFLEVSEGYCQLSGYTREELLGMNILKMEGDFALSLQQFSRIVEGHEKTFEIEQRRKDGSVWMAEVTASYTTLNDSSLFVFLHDITERMEMQKRDRILREQLAHMQKIDSIGRLTAGIGHDFNNILTSILGYTEMNKIIGEDITDECLKTDLTHNLEQVEIAGRRAVELISKMMGYCRQHTEPSDIAKMDVKKSTRQVIEEVVEMVRAGLTNKFKIELELNDRVHIFIDPIDLHQIITNLLVNARDAMKPNGGVIRVKLSTVKLLTYQCASCLMPVEGDFIELSVSDSGTGVDKKVVEQIFDPFFTTKREGEGTGLGLSTVSGIVHHAHGHILIDSEFGVGTTFRLLFDSNIKV